MGCNSICVSLLGRVVSLVCLHTQLILFQNHLQYKPIARAVTGGSHLSRIFWEHENLSSLKSNPAYPAIFSLVYIEKLPWQKIQLNQCMA